MMVRVIEIARKVLADFQHDNEENEVNEESRGSDDLSSSDSFNSYSYKGGPTDRDGWVPCHIPPPPVTREDLEVALEHWPGVPRCQVAQLERGGVPREQAMEQIREQYEHREENTR